MNRKALPLFAASFLLFHVGCASTPTSAQDWVLGEWRFRQTFSTPAQSNVLTGKIRFERGERRYRGSIYFDVLAKWEDLDEVEVSESSIQFLRPEHPTVFRGSRTGRGVQGKWQGRGGQFMDGNWEADRE